MAKHHGMEPLAGMAAHCRRGHHPTREDRFGRLFPDLAPAYVRPNILKAIGKKGGVMDGGKLPARTKTVPVGHVIFGQFIDHDITLDISSSFARVNAPEDTPNVRTPALDLDCIYGSGPEAHPFLYAQTAPFDGAKLLTGEDQDSGAVLTRNDLLRAPNSRAIIGDPRNDENRIVSQLQLGMIKFHNQMCDSIFNQEGLVGGALYEEARRHVTWHYQWAVVNDFLVAMCGRPIVNDILGCGRKYYCPVTPFIPVEFAVAAYRFGHSMVPQRIQIQKDGKPERFFGPVLGGGFTPLAHKDAIVDWHELFMTPVKRPVQTAEKLDTLMAPDLLQLPFVAAPGERSLATRNLLRGNSFLLPGGDKVAASMGRPDPEIQQVMDMIAKMSSNGITAGAPLWLYILAEAEIIGRETTAGSPAEPGEGLGPVGARIVAEVLIGLLELDPRSYLGANRSWAPLGLYNTIGEILASTNSNDLPT